MYDNDTGCGTCPILKATLSQDTFQSYLTNLMADKEFIDIAHNYMVDKFGILHTPGSTWDDPLQTHWQEQVIDFPTATSRNL